MLEPGQIHDRYSIEAMIGRGGMAVVYRVRHTALGSHHALKVLTLGGPGVRERLMQEGRLQAQLRHPNIVAVTDVLQVGDNPALILELVDGPTLDGWLEQNPRPPLDVAEAMFRGIVNAVHAAHQRGLVHRDLKPANVMLAPSASAPGGYVPKVTDFGLAKAVSEEDSQGRTRSGVTMGTPAYMAPEQIRDAKSVDQRADVFALGAILYELVCGRPAFAGNDVLSILNAVATGTFLPPESLTPDLPDRIKWAILGCLQIDRDQRLPDCGALLQVLDGASLSAVLPVPMPSGGANVTFLEDDYVKHSQPSLERVPKAPSQPSVPPQKRRWGRWIAAGVAGGGFFGAASVVVVSAAGGVFLYAKYTRDAALQAWVERTGGELQYGEASFDGAAVVLSRVAVRGKDGGNALEADEVRLYGVDGASPQRAEIHGLKAHLVERDGRIALPRSTVAALGESGLRLEEISVDRLDLDVRDDNGALRIGAGSLVLSGVELGGKSGFSAAQTTGEALEIAGAEPAIEAVTFTLKDGTLELNGAEVWLRSRTDGLLDVPPVLADAVPSWLGGARDAEGDGWWTMSPENWPIPIRSLVITNGHLHGVDRANAVKAAEWDLAVERAAFGPAQGEQGSRFLPVSLAGALSGGRVAVEGDIREDGLVRATLTARNVAATQLNAYFDPSLRKYKVKQESGLLMTRIDLTAKGSVFAAEMEGSLEGLAFSGDGPKALLTKRDVPVDLALDGDLSDPAYMPVNKLFRRVTDAAFEPAGGAVWTSHDAPVAMPYVPHKPAPKPREDDGEEAVARPAPEPVDAPAVAAVEPEPAPTPVEPAKAEDKPVEKASSPTRRHEETMKELKKALEGLRPRRLGR